MRAKKEIAAARGSRRRTDLWSRHGKSLVFAGINALAKLYKRKNFYRPDPQGYQRNPLLPKTMSNIYARKDSPLE
jgi:hypothetical protein